MYKSESGSEISLNAINVPRGSVRLLPEAHLWLKMFILPLITPWAVFESLMKGSSIQERPSTFRMESTNMFNIQTKRLFGTRVEHRFNNNFYIGGTILNLHERPLTQKVSYGNEPISNTIWGVDFGYQREACSSHIGSTNCRFTAPMPHHGLHLTVNLPTFIPGHSKAVGKSGTTYIDDFEGSKVNH
jgi:cell surface protein SprA